MSVVSPFLQNCWYMSGWGDEIDSNPLARTIAGRPILFFRDDKGNASAMLDMCPHRFAPLSRGSIRNGAVHCGYHGLAFGADGQCVHNPHGPVLKSMRVRVFPVVERHSALWIWPGDPTVADPALVPDLGFIDAVSALARVKGHLENEANYMLMVENIMDLSHADYLHPTTLGNGINTRARCQVEQAADSVTIKWAADNDILPPTQNGLLPIPGQRADFRNEVQFLPPGVMIQGLAFGPTGRIAEEGMDSRTAHVMTPASTTRTHYFFCHTSDPVTRDPAMAPIVRDILIGAFAGEDSPMLAAQQERIGDADFWSLQPMLLSIDNGSARVRRMMDGMIEAERRSLPIAAR